MFVFPGWKNMMEKRVCSVTTFWSELWFSDTKGFQTPFSINLKNKIPYESDVQCGPGIPVIHCTVPHADPCHLPGLNCSRLLGIEEQNCVNGRKMTYSEPKGVKELAVRAKFTTITYNNPISRKTGSKKYSEQFICALFLSF